MPAMIRLAAASGDVLINPDAIAYIGPSEIPVGMSERFTVPSRSVWLLGGKASLYVLDTEENIGTLMRVISMVR